MLLNNEKLVKALKYLSAKVDDYQRFYTPNLEVPYEAAQNGDLKLLKQARKHGCPFDRTSVEFAARGGHFNCVKYMIENKLVELHPDMCKAAVQGGQKEILEYLREKGCPYNIDCISIALYYGIYEMLVYLDEKEYPWPKEVFNLCKTEETCKCLEYANTKGKLSKRHLEDLIKYSSEEYHERIRNMFA